MNEAQKSGFLWVAVIGLIGVGIWWFNYSDHAQKANEAAEQRKCDDISRTAKAIEKGRPPQSALDELTGLPPSAPDETLQTTVEIPGTAVSSSALRSVGYDERQETLEIEFTSGAVYRYFDVPGEV